MSMASKNKEAILKKPFIYMTSMLPPEEISPDLSLCYVIN